MVTGFSLTGPITDELQVGNRQITDLHLIGNEIKAATPPASSRIRGGVAECQITDKAYVGNLSKKLHPPCRRRPAGWRGLHWEWQLPRRGTLEIDPQLPTRSSFQI
ncbi:hypothetical protein SLE2022_399910 [Rubroshorea leprosula]